MFSSDENIMQSLSIKKQTTHPLHGITTGTKKTINFNTGYENFQPTIGMDRQQRSSAELWQHTQIFMILY